MEIINCIQGTDEWFNEKLGKFTASEAQAIAANGKGLETLCLKLASQRLTGKRKESYLGADMKRGVELEPEARNLYELETDNTVGKVGFCKLDEDTGASPDGLIGEDGLIEIKCFDDLNFLEYALSKKMDTGYVWQMQMQMFITGRQWCDYVVYNPNYKNSLIIQRVNRDDRAIEKIKAGIETGKAIVKSIIEKVQ
jgi:hypothetical protein